VPRNRLVIANTSLDRGASPPPAPASPLFLMCFSVSWKVGRTLPGIARRPNSTATVGDHAQNRSPDSQTGQRISHGGKRCDRLRGAAMAPGPSRDCTFSK
jgi:hypothetical protein